MRLAAHPWCMNLFLEEVMMRKEIVGPIARRIDENGCPDLANHLVKSRGIGPKSGSGSSLNGYHLANPHRSALATVLRQDLQGKGYDYARRTVDMEFGKVGADLAPSERDKLAQILDSGFPRKKR